MAHKTRGVCKKEGCEKLQAKFGKAGYKSLCQLHIRMFKRDKKLIISNKKIT